MQECLDDTANPDETSAHTTPAKATQPASTSEKETPVEVPPPIESGSNGFTRKLVIILIVMASILILFLTFVAYYCTRNYRTNTY